MQIWEHREEKSQVYVVYRESKRLSGKSCAWVLDEKSKVSGGMPGKEGTA
jgi:hypothetical protein